MIEWGMTVPLDGMSREERRELRKKLREDLVTLQSLALKVQARELQLRQSQSVQVHPTDETVFSSDNVHPSEDVFAGELQLRQSQSVQVHPTDETVFSSDNVHPSEDVFAANKDGKPPVEMQSTREFKEISVHPSDDTPLSTNDEKSIVGLEMTPEVKIKAVHSAVGTIVSNNDGKPFEGMEMTPELNVIPSGLEMVPDSVPDVEVKQLEADAVPDTVPHLKVKPLGAETILRLRIKPLHMPPLKIKPRMEILKQRSFRESEVSPISTELVRNKRTPKANQLYNNTDFVVGKEKMPTLSRSRSKHRSSKKKVANGDRKRQRSMFPTDIRLQCKSLLKKLMSHRDGWIFNKPVDAEKLGLTDYHFFITSPMDLGTVRGKLDKQQYATAQEFAYDVRLTFRNAMTYNPPGNDVHQMTIGLSGMFEKGWEVIDQKVKRLEAEIELELAQEANGKSDASKLGKKARSRMPKTPADPNTPKPPKAKRKRVMTVEQRQQLGMMLQRLDDKQTEGLLNMMRERNVNLCQQDNEIEIDPDTFDNATLWEVFRTAKGFLKKPSKPKRPAVPRKPAARTEVEKATEDKVAQEELAGYDTSYDSDSDRDSLDSDSDSSDSSSGSGSEFSAGSKKKAQNFELADQPQ